VPVCFAAGVQLYFSKVVIALTIPPFFPLLK